jgi:cobalt-zinc-cadmium efflux system membrane fusion protein
MERRFPAACIAFILVVTVFAGCGEHRENDGHDHGQGAGAKAAKEKDEGVILLSEDEQRAAGIKVEKIEPREVHDHLVLTAVIQPNRDRIAHVAPRVPGRVLRVSASLGDAVRPGQTLALLDSLELGEAQSAHAQAESEHAVAKANFERIERLYRDQIVPEKEFLRVRSEFEKTRATLRAARDKLQLLGVEPIAGADRPASQFPLVAPFAGTVIEKDAVLGELAQPDKSLFTIADLRLLWIEANVYEKDLAKVRVGAPAEVTVAAYPEVVFKGRVAYISAVLDKETRTLKARIEVANADGRLRPEMFATVAIDAPGAAKALVVPEEAVVLMQGEPSLFVEEHGGFEARPVALGEKLRGEVVVKSGIESGTRVVVAGTYALKARALKAQLGAGHAH